MKPGAGMGKLAIVDKLELTAINAEFHPVIGVVDDGLQGFKSLLALRIQCLASQGVALVNIVVVVTHAELLTIIGKHRVEAVRGIVRAVLGLAVPDKGVIEALDEIGVVLVHFIVGSDEADQSAHAAAVSGLQAEETDDFRGHTQPRAIGMKGLAQVSDGSAHPVSEGFSGVFNIIEGGAAPLLVDDAAEHMAEQPVDGFVLLRAVALDWESIDDGHTTSVQGGLNPSHDPAASGELGQRIQGEWVAGLWWPVNHVQGLIQFGHGRLGKRNVPICQRWLFPNPLIRDVFMHNPVLL